MKQFSMVRISIVVGSLLGVVMVATSQPKNGQSGQSNWPTHSIIPPKVSLGGGGSHVQEFKDAATLHLNDVQGAMVRGTLRGTKTTYVITKLTLMDFYDNKFFILDRTTGGSSDPRSGTMTPAQLTVLYYVFDEGVDMMVKNGAAGKSNLEATPTGISGRVSAKDLGMTSDQLRQMVIHSAESHPMRFWNEARVGLASGR
jgi:hypothetical protein